LLTKPIHSRAEREARLCDNRKLAAWWAAGLLLAAAAGYGVDVRAQEGGATLTVKPVLCVTDRREEGCPLSITVSWRSDDEGDYCLHSELADRPIRCWESAAAGMVVEERVIRETFSYWLTNGANATLAEATLELLTTDSDDRRRNRRRRHVWDIL
jgi:hypothetical protein